MEILIGMHKNVDGTITPSDWSPIPSAPGYVFWLFGWEAIADCKSVMTLDELRSIYDDSEQFNLPPRSLRIEIDWSDVTMIRSGHEIFTIVRRDAGPAVNGPSAYVLEILQSKLPGPYIRMSKAEELERLKFAAAFLKE